MYDTSEASRNPFLDKNGNVFNKYIDYQKLLDSPKVTQKAKEFISQATGLTPTVSEATGNVSSGNAVSQTSGNQFVDTAKQYLGTPYVWGGTTPNGFDCSGLVQYVYAQNGINIPRVSQDQYKSGASVAKENLQPGDLVFFTGYTKDPSNPGHVGMYVGNGEYLHAPKTGDVVKVSSLSDRSDYVGARRYY